MSPFRRLIFPCFFLITSGCATGLINSKNATSSRIEIDYVLGHNHYQYTAVGGENKAEVSSSRDGQVLEKKVIPLARYQDFAKKLETALNSTPLGVNQDCRTPYTVHIVADGRENTVSGCRSADTKGRIGQLLREGEFILYSDEAAETKR